MVTGTKRKEVGHTALRQHPVKDASARQQVVHLLGKHFAYAAMVMQKSVVKIESPMLRGSSMKVQMLTQIMTMVSRVKTGARVLFMVFFRLWKGGCRLVA